MKNMLRCNQRKHFTIYSFGFPIIVTALVKQTYFNIPHQKNPNEIQLYLFTWY
jgi:hypothetical protein